MPKALDPYMEHGKLYIKYRRIAIALVIFNVLIFTIFGILFWRHLKSVEKMGGLQPVQVFSHIKSLGTESVLTPGAPSSGIGTLIEGAVQMYSNEEYGVSFAYPSEWGAPVSASDDPNIAFRFPANNTRLTSRGLEPQKEMRNCTDLMQRGYFSGHLLPEDCVTISVDDRQIPVVTVGLFEYEEWGRVRIAQIPTKKGLYFFIVEDSMQFKAFSDLIRSMTFLK